MMIDEYRHLADNATLNKHRKVTSEAYARALSIIAERMRLHTPVANCAGAGTAAHCPPFSDTANLQTSDKHTAPLLALTLASPA